MSDFFSLVIQYINYIVVIENGDWPGARIKFWVTELIPSTRSMIRRGCFVHDHHYIIATEKGKTQRSTLMHDYDCQILQ